MPTMAGTELASAIARIAPALPVVLISGYSDINDEALAAAGIKGRLDKPFTLEQLDRIVRQALHRDRGGK